MELDGNKPLKCEYWWLSKVSLQKEDCAKPRNYSLKNYRSNSSFTQGTINLKSSAEIIDISVNEGTAFLTGMSLRFLSSQRRTEQNKIYYDFAAALIEAERKDYDCQTSIRKFLFSFLLGSALLSQPTRAGPGRDLPRCASVAQVCRGCSPAVHPTNSPHGEKKELYNS